MYLHGILDENYSKLSQEALFPSPVASEAKLQNTESMILTTKISKPSASTKTISRSHLIERLNKGLQHKLTLIIAPAGYGKTTLLNEWVMTMADARAVAWVSVDYSDTNEIRFWSHIIASLTASLNATLDNAILPHFNLTQYSSIESALTVFINALATSTRDVVLVLDNYLAIDIPSIHRGINFLLEYLPPNMHVIIAGRTIPPLPLARLRIESHLIEMYATDLRLTTQEIKLLLSQSSGKVLREDVITAVENYTEGWIVGVCIIANSLASQEHATISSLYNHQFKRDHRYIRDYLDHEVFSPLPKHLQDFLLYTAVLDQLSGDVCDAITSRQDSRILLEWLEQNSLFIIPIEKEPGNYSYHQIFRDFLLDRLHRVLSSFIPTIHRRARIYYEQNGLETKAIDHALATHDIKDVTRLIEKVWITIIETGEISLLPRWLDDLPEEAIYSSPRLALFYAWYYFIIGKISIAEECLGKIKDQLLITCEVFREGAPLDSLLEIKREVMFLDALESSIWRNTSFKADFPINLFKQIFDYKCFWRSVCLVKTSIAYWLRNDVDTAIRSFDLVGQFRYKPHYINGELTLYCLLAQMYLLLGHLQFAEMMFEQSLQLINLEKEAGHEYRALTYLGRGQLLYERNDLNAAMKCFSESIALSLQQGDGEMLAYSYALLALVKQAQGEDEHASQSICLSEQQVQQYNVPSRAAAYVAICHAKLLLFRGEVDAASQCLQQSSVFYSRRPHHTIVARILLAQGRYEEAFKVLEQLFVSARTAKKIGKMIETQLLLALVCQKQSKVFEALAFLEHAFSLAETEGYCRLFVDEGARMGELIEMFIARKQLRDDTPSTSTLISYGRKLLAIIRRQPEDALPPLKCGLIQLNQSLAEPLREREIDVLYLIATGLSNQEIAQRMVVATSTIKWHIKNIYGKLNIRSRAEAISLVYNHVPPSKP